MKMGQVATMAVMGAVAFIGTWAGNYLFNSPIEAGEANAATVEKVSKVENRLNVLCNDYGQTVSRMDQNIQSIGQALKVPVVIGNPGSDPCKK